MKLWIDAVCPAPKNFFWAKTVNEAKRVICDPVVCLDHTITLIDVNSVDSNKLINWLNETNRSYPIRIHAHDNEAIAKMRSTRANLNQQIR